VTELAAARLGFIAALRSGDGEAAAAAYTTDARLLAPSAELLSGRDAIAAFWQAGIEAGVDSIELQALDLEVDPGGDAAVEIGRYVLRLTPSSGQAIEDRGRYLLVYRRENDGVWRRAAETFNPGDGPERRAAPGPVLADGVVDGGAVRTG
jgi:uncharacterized protein (TIGR02246 family)